MSQALFEVLRKNEISEFPLILSHRCCYYLDFVDKETEDQRGEALVQSHIDGNVSEKDF